MKSAVWFFLGLVLGAAGGAYVAKSIAEKKAEDQIEKATVEARNYYKEKYEPKKEEPVKEPEKVTRIFGKAFDLYPVPKNTIVEEETEVDHHYITPISQQEYDDEEEYSKCTLDCYADGIVTDEMDNDVEDPGGIVGSDTLDKLSNENPVAYVRNDETQTVYEICYIDAYYEPEGGIED